MTSLTISIQLQDIWTIYLISIIFTLNRWFTEYTAEAAFLDLNLAIDNGAVSIKIYDKLNDFDFDNVDFPFLDEDLFKVFIYFTLFALPHYLRMLLTSIVATNF